MFVKFLKRIFRSKSLTIQPIRSNGNLAIIIFIHGFLGDQEKTWGGFPALIKNEQTLSGWDIYSFGYSSKAIFDFPVMWRTDPNIKILSKKLFTTIQNDSRLGFEKTYTFVAHSMGGLVLQRAIIDYPKLADITTNIFLYGTPSLGLKKAAILRLFKKQIADMEKDGLFIKELRNDWKKKFPDKKPFSFSVIAGEKDSFVPSESSLSAYPDEECYVADGDHSSIIKPNNRTDLSFQIFLHGITGQTKNLILNYARVAFEKRNFNTLINNYNEHKDGMDDKAAVNYAIALDSTGDKAEALALLSRQIAKSNGNPDIYGTIAGRYKRIWLETRIEENAQKAMKYYNDGFDISVSKNDYAQIYYHSINLAFMNLMYKNDKEETTKYAKIALAACEKDKLSYWCLATKAEAYIYLGNTERTIEIFKNAIKLSPEPWYIYSTYLHLENICAELKQISTLKIIKKVIEEYE